MGLTHFDAYRDDEARKLMIEFVCRSRSLPAPRAIEALRELNHVGLAYVYADAIVAVIAQSPVDYDPCEVRR